MEKAKEIFQYTLAALINLSFFALLTMMIFYPPKEDNQILIAMTATLGTITVMVDSYFFGSSKGSSDKTKLLNGKK